MNYNDAVETAKRGSLIARDSWDSDYGVIFFRPDDTLPAGVIPNVKSLPDDLKNYIEKTKIDEEDILFTGYLARYSSKMYNNNRSEVQNAWTPSNEDIIANDWYTLEV